MYRTKTKIWTGLGAFVLSTSTLQATDISKHSDKAYRDSPFSNITLKGDSLSTGLQPLYIASKTGYGGEGGEAGAAGGASPDEAYMTMLMLMRGHLRVGKALVDRNNWDDAIMHFMHPVEEIYDQLSSELEQRNVQPFRTALQTLAETVSNHRGGNELEQQFKAVQSAIDQAINALPASVSGQPTFKLDVALRVLQQAAVEYNAAITDGQIVNVAEYQDSRGFVWIAEELLNSSASELEQRNPEAWQSVRSLLADIKQVWPDVNPPPQPVQPISRVLSNISRINLQASQLR